MDFGGTNHLFEWRTSDDGRQRVVVGGVSRRRIATEIGVHK